MGHLKCLYRETRLGRRRNSKIHLNFRVLCRLIFSANEIPESDDKSFAYFRRWIILFFEKVFEGKNNDTKLIEKLTTPEEMSGLLNLALIALKQLIKDNEFIHTDDIATVRENII